MNSTSHVADPISLRAEHAAPRRWWLLERSPRGVDRFRALAGAALGVHFIAHWLETSSLFVWSSPEDLALLGHAFPTSPWLAAIAQVGLRPLFAVAVLLALALGFGVAPRASAAALFAISVLTYRLIFPIAGLDDYLANVTALFLVLMPLGRSRLFGSRGAQERTDTVSGVAVCVYLSFVTLLYLTSGFGHFPRGGGAHGFVFDVALRLIPVAFVLPVAGLSIVGIALQLAVQGYFLAMTPSLFASLVLAASSVLFWGERGSSGNRARTIDAGAVVAALAAVLSAALIASALLRPAVELMPAARVLYDAGLLPPPVAPAPHHDALRFAVTDVGSSQRRTVSVPGHGRLASRLAAKLGSDGRDRARTLAFATSLSRAYCREQGYMGQQGVLSWLGDGDERSLAEFECGAGGSLDGIR